LEGASIASEKIWTFENLQPKTDTKNGLQKMGHKKWVKKLGEMRRAARRETENRRQAQQEEAGSPGNRTQEAFKARAPAHPQTCIYSALQLLAGMLSAKCLISFGAKLSTPENFFPDSQIGWHSIPDS
jgi:hypothetical protein